MPFTPRIGRRSVLAGAAALAGCRAPSAPVETVPRLSADRTGYIAINAPIVAKLRDLFIADVNLLLDQNALVIYVLMSSPGGSVDVAQEMIAYIDRTQASRDVKFIMHNVGVVASAACYVFLAAQHRVSIPGGEFLFHEASLMTSGAITSQVLQEEAVKAEQIDRLFLAMLTANTRLTAAEASSFVRRTVILNAEEARRDGVIDTVSGFVLPPGANISVIQATTVGPAGQARL